MEKWRTVKEFPDYEVSTLGRVLNAKTGRIRKLCDGGDGYLMISFTAKKSRRVHRVVAEAFLGKIRGKQMVNHLDGDKKHNCIENLEYVTIKENNQHARRTGLCNQNGSASILSKLTEKEVYAIRAKWAKGTSMTELAQIFYVTISNISCIVLRKSWKHI